jgi:beta-phosphoglucomutase-like phosphatase (HAD superfamily)
VTPPALDGLGPRVLLCDADGNLFPSEEPAFEASADVTNRFLASVGVARRYTAEELLALSTGLNFRTTAVALATEHGAAVPDGPTLDQWVAQEKAVVSAHLGRTLRPDPAVLGPLTRLGERCTLAAVSSSALSRLDVCFRAAGLAELLPPGRRYSAEDSLPTPTSKPDPAVYLLAVAELGVDPQECLAVEDSLPGVQSAVAAGCPTVGNTAFVPTEQRTARAAQLLDAGALAVVTSWAQLEEPLLRAVRTTDPGR